MRVLAHMLIHIQTHTHTHTPGRSAHSPSRAWCVRVKQKAHLTHTSVCCRSWRQCSKERRLGLVHTSGIHACVCECVCFLIVTTPTMLYAPHTTPLSAEPSTDTSTLASSDAKMPQRVTDITAQAPAGLTVLDVQPRGMYVYMYVCMYVCVYVCS
jgi:hypothetical protein